MHDLQLQSDCISLSLDYEVPISLHMQSTLVWYYKESD